MSDNLTSAQLDEIEATARAALVGSPQGWTAHREDDYDYSVDAGGAYLGACPDCGVRSSFDKEDATHIATFDPPTALALVAEVRELRAKVEQVRALHEPYGCSEPGCIDGCAECESEYGWPCDTIKALGEEA